MESDKNEDYIIWTGYDGLDEDDILAAPADMEDTDAKK